MSSYYAKGILFGVLLYATGREQTGITADISKRLQYISISRLSVFPNSVFDAEKIVAVC